MEVSGQLHASAALHPRKEPPVSMEIRLGSPMSWSGASGEENNTSLLFLCRDSIPGRPACSPVTILTELHRFISVFIRVKICINWLAFNEILLSWYLLRITKKQFKLAD
jgi:hypothetical protein